MKIIASPLLALPTATFGCASRAPTLEDGRMVWVDVSVSRQRLNAPR